uniref:Uncharacterized protein n=2 Tax=Culex quinquefasciatus TaxID=7176 RepID=A0A1S4JHG6_CULQU
MVLPSQQTPSRATGPRFFATIFKSSLPELPEGPALITTPGSLINLFKSDCLSDRFLR